MLGTRALFMGVLKAQEAHGVECPPPPQHTHLTSDPFLPTHDAFSCLDTSNACRRKAHPIRWCVGAVCFCFSQLSTISPQWFTPLEFHRHARSATPLKNSFSDSNKPRRTSPQSNKPRRASPQDFFTNPCSNLLILNTNTRHCHSKSTY